MGGDEREDIYDPCPECGNKDMKYVNHEPSWSCGMRTLEVQCPACEELFDVTEYEPDPF